MIECLLGMGTDGQGVGLQNFTENSAAAFLKCRTWISFEHRDNHYLFLGLLICGLKSVGLELNSKVTNNKMEQKIQSPLNYPAPITIRQTIYYPITPAFSPTGLLPLHEGAG